VERERLHAEAVARAVGELAIDRVFHASVRLNSEAIQDFVHQLCAVSIQELQTVGSHGSQSTFQHRIFSLQKVVEVADANMDIRPRAVWSRAWSTLSKFFTAVGCHANQGIAMFAIDSLKQVRARRRLFYGVGCCGCVCLSVA